MGYKTLKTKEPIRLIQDVVLVFGEKRASRHNDLKMDQTTEQHIGPAICIPNESNRKSASFSITEFLKIRIHYYLSLPLAEHEKKTPSDPSSSTSQYEEEELKSKTKKQQKPSQRYERSKSENPRKKKPIVSSFAFPLERWGSKDYIVLEKWSLQYFVQHRIFLLCSQFSEKKHKILASSAASFALLTTSIPWLDLFCGYSNSPASSSFLAAFLIAFCGTVAGLLTLLDMLLQYAEKAQQCTEQSLFLPVPYLINKWKKN